MGSINIGWTGKDELEDGVRDKATDSPSKASEFIDQIANVYYQAMIDLTPEVSGETKNKTIIEVVSDLFRSIYSTVPYWEALVGGHNVFGPIFSDLQRRWWFWYLNTVLGGEYELKTAGYKGGDDYPLEAFYNAEGDVEDIIDQFGEWFVE